MGALTKADMAERLYEELGLNKREAKEIVEMFFEEIRAALESGNQVKLSGFGNFDLRDKNQRPGRNPKLDSEKCGSKIGSSTCDMACWISRSNTVGIPSGRVPPVGFGISTRFTGKGW